MYENYSAQIIFRKKTTIRQSFFFYKRTHNGTKYSYSWHNRNSTKPSFPFEIDPNSLFAMKRGDSRYEHRLCEHVRSIVRKSWEYVLCLYVCRGRFELFSLTNRYTSDNGKTNIPTKYILIIVETEIFTSFCHDDPYGHYRVYGAILAEAAQKYVGT